MSARKTGLASFLMVVAAWAGAASAAETDWWVVDTASDMLSGKGDGVAVTAQGQLKAVPSWQSAVTFEEPVILASDQMPNGDLVVATGHPARLYRVRRRSAELMTELPGEQATAVHVAADQSVWVATVAPGALHRWHAKDGLEEIARLEEGGFWDIVELDGVVVAAAGPPAALYRFESGSLQRWVELPDGFVRSMVVKGDAVIVGTSGKGLIARVDAEGRPLVLVDSPFTEISDLAIGPSGDVYATALVGEPATQPKATVNSGNGDSENSSSTVQTEGGGALDLDLPKVNGKTATSEVFRLTETGALLHMRRFPKQVASALTSAMGGVLVGTGYEGEVWFFDDIGGARMATIDAVQVVAFSPDGKSLLAQGPAAVFRQSERGDHPNRFQSASKTFARPVRFGAYRLIPEDSGAKIRFRSGAASGPDPLWMPWTEFSETPTGTIDIEFGKVLQWEVEIPSGALLDRVEVASREINLAPVIKSLTVEAPGVVYLMNPPPSGPVIRHDHPTFEGVFSTISASDRKNGPNAKGKKFYQVGFRTVSWKANDANGDALLFDLALENTRGFSLPVRERLRDERIAVDTSAAPDDRYRFRLTASDVETNPGAGRQATATSEWFQVDNTPPTLTTERTDDRWMLTVRDTSTIAKVEASRNGGRWQALEPRDGLLDGSVEQFDFATEDGSNLIVFRAFDRHHNRASMGVEE